ncbi:MAG: site-2 protease family protein [Nitrospinota bacterium]|nr:site-2 protease family protein [Nitrospinota bacterium]
MQGCALLISIIIAVVFHEVAHGYTALRLGDRTAKLMGRLTLNPIAHVHWFGTIVMPALLYSVSMAAFGQPFVFAFAKPVPVDFRNLRDPKKDMIWVAAAGPATNIVLAVISAMSMRVLGFVAPDEYLLFKFQINSNTLDLTGSLMSPLLFFLLASVYINIVLALINLIPVPPADGGRIVTGLLPDEEAVKFASIEKYGLLILIFILFYNPLNIINWTIRPLINVILYLLLGD